ncbi:MAG: SLC13 family permease [Acidobacteriota bacterium]
MQIAAVLFLLVAAIVVLSIEIWSVDVVAVLLMLTLVITRILTPEEALSGFGDPSLVMIGSILVMTAAIVQTGVANRLGMMIGSLAGHSETRFFALATVAVTCVSAFINNVAATAIFVPIVIGVARRQKWSPAKFLMPVAFGSILGGTCTLIGTSTNVAVSGVLPRYELKPFELFEFAPIGLAIATTGVLYMTLFGRKLIPDRGGEDLVQEYHIKEYLTEIVVSPNSTIKDRSVEETGLRRRFDINVIGIVRQNRRLLFPDQDERFRVNDLLLVEGKLENIMHLKDETGVEIKAEINAKDFTSEQVQMIEVVVSPRSGLAGQTIKEANFRQRYGLNALAIYRQGETLVDKLGRIRLEVGDTLLVQGESHRISSLRNRPGLIVLGEIPFANYRRRKARVAILIFLAAIAVGGIGLLPISVSFLMGAVAMVLSGCLTIQQAYENIEWRVLFLIAGMLAMGTAMDTSGAARFLAEKIIELLGAFGPQVILASFFWVTVLLTQPLSNAAAALLVLPIGISTAQSLGVNPRTFAMMICIAASISVITPLEPACILVYGPGKYQFLDFVKNGSIITFLAFLIAITVIPYFWPLGF